MNQHKQFERWAVAILRWSLGHRALVLLLAALMLGPLIAHGVHHIRQVDNSLPVWFEEDDPSYRYYDQFKEEFGSDEFLAIAFGADDVFSPRAVLLQQQIVDGVEQVRGIEEVRSLLTTSHIEGDDDSLIIDPLIPREGKLSDEERARARAMALADPSFIGQFLSADGKSVAVLARIEDTEDIAVKARITEDVKDVLRTMQSRFPEFKVYLSGAPALDYEFDALSREDQDTFFPLVFVTTTLMLFLIFGRPSHALIPTFLQFAVLLSAMGIFYVFNDYANMAVGMIVPILVAVSIGDSVHILARFNALGESITDRRERLLATIADEARPCLFTSLTTTAGFFSFVTSDVEPMRQLGIFSGIGCMLAYVVTLILIPVILSFMGDRPRRLTIRMKRPRADEEEKDGPLQSFLARTAQLTTDHPWQILWASLSIVGACLIGAVFLRVESSMLEFIPASHPVRQGLTFIQDNLTGLAPLEVIVQTEEDGGKDPELLRKIDAVQAKMEALPVVSNSLSTADYLKLINQELHAGDSAEHRVPDTREEVAQYLLLAEMSGDEEIEKYVNYEYSRLRITTMAMSGKSANYKSVVSRMKDALEKWLPDYRTHITGIIDLYGRFDHLLMTSQAKSFGGAFAVIFLFMWILAGNFRLALLAMVPNGLPIAMTAGIMGYANISLDPGTVFVAGIAMGIVVDDTVHYLSCFRRELEFHGDYTKALHAAHRHVGPAIVFTSTILTIGFLVLLAGNFSPVRNFGLLTSLTMAFAVVADLFLLPALLVLMRPLPLPARAEEGEAAVMETAGV
ncbi:MAG: MMPL family transporter [Chrysiogenetes bacterium]|nr:MMPL family transporter [Chrysiogenetes bacterium]